MESGRSCVSVLRLGHSLWDKIKVFCFRQKNESVIVLFIVVNIHIFWKLKFWTWDTCLGVKNVSLACLYRKTIERRLIGIHKHILCEWPRLQCLEKLGTVGSSLDFGWCIIQFQYSSHVQHTKKRKAFIHRQWIWPSNSRNRLKSSLTEHFMEMLTSALSLGSAQKSLHFDCKFPLSWGWMHRQIKLSMYFSEVWLTMCQSEWGRQPVYYQRSSSGRPLHCAHSHPPPSTQDWERRAMMPKLRATQKPLFIPLFLL